MPRRSRLLAVALAAIAALVVGLLAGQAGASQAKPPANVKGLKIMLTNDDSVQGVKADGSDGKGLYELRKALCAAGADVIVVGPWGQQSGQGGRITTDRSTGLTVTPAPVPEAYAGDCAGASAGGAAYGVCNSNTACVAGSPSASPSDTVKIAVENFLPANYWPSGPDLVLSGINWGQNAGIGVFHSGTTSAAVTAPRARQAGPRLQRGAPGHHCGPDRVCHAGHWLPRVHRSGRLRGQAASARSEVPVCSSPRP